MTIKDRWLEALGFTPGGPGRRSK
ncbi:hypothetical protein [Pantoea septica]